MRSLSAQNLGRKREKVDAFLRPTDVSQLLRRGPKLQRFQKLRGMSAHSLRRVVPYAPSHRTIYMYLYMYVIGGDQNSDPPVGIPKSRRF